MRVFDAVCASHWAITEDALQVIQEIASRENDVSPEALEAYRAQSLARAERATRRDGVAMLYVQGSLFKRANLMTEYSGASSYDVLRRDLQVALDDPSISGIALVIDSPGGEVNGVGEFAKAVYEARSVKPVTAFVSGMAASGGYWIAAAANEIVVSDESLLGSIGVVSSFVDTSARDERLGLKRVEIVSSMAPGKRPDITSDEGKAQILKVLDDLHQVFAGAIATYRGVKVDTVNTKFGRGGLEVGANAVAAGMADRIGTLEGVISSLSAPRGVGRSYQRSNGGILMSDTQTYSQADFDKAVAEAVAKQHAEASARRSAILSSEHAAALAPLASHLAEDLSVSADSAKAILGVAAKLVAEKVDAAKAETAAPKTPANPAQGFAERKAAAGALVGAPDAADAPDAAAEAEAAAGWAKARARHGIK